MDTQNNVCKPEAEPEAYQIKRIRGVTFPSIAGIKPGPRYYKETTVPFEQDYICATCKQTDRSCPMRNYTVEECSFYSPDLPRIYAPLKQTVQPIDVFNALLRELQKAELKHPDFPSDPYRQIAILGEEYGEAVQALNNLTFHGGSWEKFDLELRHTGAMVIRMLMNLDCSNG